MHVVASRDIFVRYFTALYFLLSYGRTRIQNIINIYIYSLTIICVCFKILSYDYVTHICFLPTIKFPFFYVVSQKQAI